MSKLVVGIHGYAGSGKSAAAGVLVDQGFKLMKFAGPLKAAAAAMFEKMGVQYCDIYEMIEGNMKEEPVDILGGASPREVMQHLGSSFREKFCDCFWTRPVLLSLIGRSRPVVIDDVRYENEVATVRSVGGYTIKIVRPGVGPVNGHVSDAGLPDELFDVVITNDGTIDDLRNDVEAALRFFKKRNNQRMGGDKQ